eukprot:TRINITY_DN19181_c0_g1_i1.p1 TRINITY_DN19181_c0_g1~~TRINITY_DN19181_c0_g1_i1.p1  ORF type:complete len:1191 (-),score=227.26 TRINITY_DN19181_c0_g1_i1:107-3679(-)
MDDDGKAAAKVVAIFRKAEPPRQFVLPPGDVLVFGRAGDCDVVLPSRGISSRHAMLRHKPCASGGSEMFLEDTSTNGTGTCGGDQTTWSPLRKGESRQLETSLQILLPLNSKEESAVLTICVFGDGLPDAYDERRRVGRWLYRGKLGEGALGIVHKASDLTGKLGEAVAIKVAKTAKGAKKTSKLRNAFILHREAQWSLQRLHNKSYSGFSAEKARLFARYLEDHTGKWSELDFDSERKLFEGQDYRWDKFKPPVAIPEKPYVAIEYVPGRTLHAALGWSREQPLHEGQGVLDDEERHLVAKQAAEALTYLISQNLIHRDFRTTNLMIVGKGPDVSVRVIDLGHTILAEPGHQRNKSPIVRCNMKEEEKKRFEWAPPEVKAKEHFLNFALPVHSFDVFSMAVLAVQLQVREHPEARVAVDRLMGIQSGDCLPSAVGLPQEFLRLMLGMPLKRPPIEEIQRILNQKRKAVTEAEPERQSKRQATIHSGSMDKSPTVELASESDNPHPPTSVVEYDDASKRADGEGALVGKTAVPKFGSAAADPIADEEGKVWDQLEQSAKQQSKAKRPGKDQNFNLLAPLPGVDDLLDRVQLEKEPRGTQEVACEQQRDRHAQPSQQVASEQPVQSDYSGNTNPERKVEPSQQQKTALPAEQLLPQAPRSARVEKHSHTKQEKLQERVELPSKPLTQDPQVAQAEQPVKAASPNRLICAEERQPIQTEILGQPNPPDKLISGTRLAMENLQTVQAKGSERSALPEHTMHVKEQPVQAEQQQPVPVEFASQPDRAGNLEPMPSKQEPLLEQMVHSTPASNQSAQAEQPVQPVLPEQLIRVDPNQHVHVQPDQPGRVSPPPVKRQEFSERSSQQSQPDRHKVHSVPAEQSVQSVQVPVQLDRPEQRTPPPAMQEATPEQSAHTARPNAQQVDSMQPALPEQPTAEQQQPPEAEFPVQARQGPKSSPARKNRFAQPLQPGPVRPGLLLSSGATDTANQAEVIDQPSRFEEPGRYSLEQTVLDLSGHGQSERVSWLLQQLQQIRRSSKPQSDSNDEPQRLQQTPDAFISQEQLEQRKEIESNRHFSKASAAVSSAPDQLTSEPVYGPCRLPTWPKQKPPTQPPRLLMPTSVPDSQVPEMPRRPQLILPTHPNPNILPNMLPGHPKPRTPFGFQLSKALSFEASQRKHVPRFQTQILPRPHAARPY